MVLANISGQADETIYRRLEKQCRDYEVKEAAPRASSDFKSKGFKAGLGEVRSSLYKGKGSGSTPFAPKKDFSRIQCFNCLLFGHYKDHFPVRRLRLLIRLSEYLNRTYFIFFSMFLSILFIKFISFSKV